MSNPIGEASTPNSSNLLRQAEKLVLGSRHKDYGHPLDNFTKTAKMWEPILGQPITAEQVGLCMIAVKLARQAYIPKHDNLVDIAGYAATLEMLQEERMKREDLETTFCPKEELEILEKSSRNIQLPDFKR